MLIAVCRFSRTLLSLLVLFSYALAQSEYSVNREEGAQDEKKGDMISLADFGAQDLGFIAFPRAKEPPKGSILIVHDRYGMTPGVKATVMALSALNFITLSVDLYNGNITNDPLRAEQLAGELRQDAALNTIKAGVKMLRTWRRTKGTKGIALVGWGLGGKLVVAAAPELEGVSAVVAFYGLMPLQKKQIQNIDASFYGFYGKNDSLITHQIVNNFTSSLKAENKDAAVFFYDAGHRFADPLDKGYQQEASRASMLKMVEVLEVRFKRPAPEVKEPGVLDKVEDKFKSLFD